MGDDAWCRPATRPSDRAVARRNTASPPRGGGARTSAGAIIGAMSETVRTPGAEVTTPRGPGVVVDVRATPSGQFVIGVEDDTGEVCYFTEKVLRLASG